MRGEYLKSYQLPSEWKNANWATQKSFDRYQKFHYALKTPDGLIFLSDTQKKLEQNGIKEGDKIILDFGRLSLLSWYPLK